MTSTAVAPDLSESDLRHGLFHELDAQARSIEKIFKSSWLELADICISMRDGQYWREGGFTSYNSWLLSACPCSRSWAYMAVGAREELKEIPIEDLREMPLGNAETLKLLPRSLRSDPEILEAAKSTTPREFVSRATSVAANTHIEQNVTIKFKGSASRAKVIQSCLDMWRMLNNEELSDMEVMEAVCAFYMLAHQTEWNEINAKNA